MLYTFYFIVSVMKQKLILETEVKKLFKKASEILRETTIEQCFGDYNIGNKYCALGVLANYLGWGGGSDKDYVGYGDKVYALTGNDGYLIYRMNDRGMSFSQIADYLEERGL